MVQASQRDDAAVMFLLVPAHDTGGIPRISGEREAPAPCPARPCGSRARGSRAASSNPSSQRRIMLRIRQNDHILLDLWRRGDQAAGKELFERHYDLLFRFFATEMATGQAELVVETLRTCLADREPVPRHKDFRVHLLASAHRVLGTRYPRHRLRKDRALLDLSEETEPSASSELADTLDAAADTFSQSDVTTALGESTGGSDELRLRALRRLQGEARMLIELHDVERLSEQDIAEILDMTAVAVTRGLNHARRQLARAMERAVVEDTEDTEDALDMRFADGSHVAPSSAGIRLDRAPLDEVGSMQFPQLVDDSTPAREVSALPRERIEIVLDGDVAQIDPATRRRIIEEARETSGDPALSITSILPGSVLLELDVSPDAAAMLVKLFASGDLESLGGLPILDLRRLDPALPAATSAATHEGAEAALSDFLVSAFAADELRRLVRSFPDGARLESALPGPSASLSHLASDVVLVLVRHDLVSAALFERLEAERPHRCDELRRIRQRLEGADAGLGPPSQ